jgi:hypothetical protein
VELQLRFQNPDGSWGAYVDLAGQDGTDGTDGAKGAKGDAGEDGLAPEHEWIGTQLRFRNPDTSWGTTVNLKGEKGDTGDTGQAGAVGPPGQTGQAPEHQWNGTSLRFRLPSGVWGVYVDLKGDQGDAGSPPEHEVSGNRIRFRQSDGSWGSWLSTGGQSRVTLTQSGTTMVINYSGLNAPVLTGSNGVYTLTVPSGTLIHSMRWYGPTNTDTLTAGDAYLQVVSEDGNVFRFKHSYIGDNDEEVQKTKDVQLTILQEADAGAGTNTITYNSLDADATWELLATII